MVNKEIARQFNLLANLMELHGENAFKTKAYSGAYLVLRKWDKPIEDMDKSEIEAIHGIGSSVASKIHELITTGKIDVLEKYKEKTPEGVQQMLSIKGLGPKKVKQIWDELKVESPAELLYACNENRLVKLSGFGLKTQEDVRKKIEYFLESAHQFLYGTSEEELNAWLVTFQKTHSKHRIEWVGEMERKSPVLNKLELLISPALSDEAIATSSETLLLESPQDEKVVEVLERFRITLHFSNQDHVHQKWSELTMSPSLFQKIGSAKSYKSNSAVAEQLKEIGMDDLPSELMDKEGIESLSPPYWHDLVTQDDLKGIIHNHSTWSDGINTLEEMAAFVRDQGYQYFVICDHSRSAFYANGLNAERVLEQFEEIDALNKKLAPFKVFKGIESDILNDGSLDYEDEILSKFDLIVASVHSNLRMDEAKAMTRLLKAIENPHTRILGHPTGRLLLARQGYPIDHQLIIDACAANKVAIELNANPLRLDMDYRWMEYCMKKEVPVSINPDAHSRAQVAYVKYGTLAARKGGLKKGYCLNAKSLEEFEVWLKSK